MANASNSKSKIQWDQMKVLVVEDEPDLREILMMVFEQEGSRVLSARDGLEAMEIAQTQLPDLIISDVRMPNCDGIQFLEAFRKKYPLDPPIFLATGYADIDEEQAVRKGASSLISKPFNMKDLFLILETKLRSHERFTKWVQT